MIFVGGIKENKRGKPEFAWETHAPEMLLFFSHMLPRSLVIPFFVVVVERWRASDGKEGEKTGKAYTYFIRYRIL